MKKIKQFYKEHRVFTILMAIVIVCVILIATVLIQCFYIGNGTDKYGNRLDGIEKYEISEARQSDFENNIANNDKVMKADLILQGRIVYVTLQFEQSVSLEEAKSIALKSLDEFSEEEQKYYDFMFTLKQDVVGSDGFVISGAKNASGTNLVWNNNTKVTSSSANTKE